MLRSDLCDYNDAYIVVKGAVTIKITNNESKINKKLVFKNKAPFKSCISKINNRFIENAEDLDVVVPMYNLLEYSSSYPITSGNLSNYYTDEINDDENENNASENMIHNSKTTISKPFKYKTKIIGSTPNNGNRLNAQVVLPLKYLSNFWRFLDLPLINCEVELDFLWPKYCVTTEISKTYGVVPNTNPLGIK